MSIRVTDMADRQAKLLEAFAECQAGHCTCPTDEYQKVAGMDVRSAADEITLWRR